jgi:hypothetical protein
MLQRTSNGPIESWITYIIWLHTDYSLYVHTRVSSPLSAKTDTPPILDNLGREYLSNLKHFQDNLLIVDWVMECSTSTLGRKFTLLILVLYGTLCTYFHRMTSPASVRFQNVFCSKSYFNDTLFHHFKPSLSKRLLMDIVHSSAQVKT